MRWDWAHSSVGQSLGKSSAGPIFKRPLLEIAPLHGSKQKRNALRMFSSFCRVGAAKVYACYAEMAEMESMPFEHPANDRARRRVLGRLAQPSLAFFQHVSLLWKRALCQATQVGAFTSSCGGILQKYVRAKRMTVLRSLLARPPLLDAWWSGAVGSAAFLEICCCWRGSFAGASSGM